MIGVGDLTTNFLKTDSVDDFALPGSGSINNPAQNTENVMSDIGSRIAVLENMIEFKVDSGNILSAIALTSEQLVITANRIGVLGQVTFMDYIRDQNGTATGTIDPKITQVIGDKIRTGSIWSNSWIDTSGASGMVMDLDNSTFYLGGDTTPTLKFVGDTMEMWGNIAVKDRGSELGLFKTGTANYTTSGGATGSGVLMGTPGIFGISSGVLKFGFDASTGNAVFAGDITGSSGTFSGSLSGATITGASGTFSGLLSSSKQVRAVTSVNDTGTGYAGYFDNNGTGTMLGGVFGEGYDTGVKGESTSGNGVWGESTGGRGVYGKGSSQGVFGTASSSTGYGVYCANTGGGKALGVSGTSSFTGIATMAGLQTSGSIYPDATNTRYLGTSTRIFGESYIRNLHVTRLYKSSWSTGQIQISTSSDGSNPFPYYYRFI